MADEIPQHGRWARADPSASKLMSISSSGSILRGRRRGAAGAAIGDLAGEGSSLTGVNTFAVMVCIWAEIVTFVGEETSTGVDTLSCGDFVSGLDCCDAFVPRLASRRASS